jgi:LytR cell envelope-related transcriptional attenuator
VQPAVIEIVKTLGAYAGLGSVAAVALLSLLYISQARDVRRLRDWAGRAPERAAAAEQALLAYETGEQPLEYEPDEHAVAAPAGEQPVAQGAPVAAVAGAPPAPPEAWQIEAEAAAAAEVELRREERERALYTTEREGPFGEHSVIIMVAGSLILLFAIVFAASQVLGGGGGTGTEAGSPATQAPSKRGGATSPGQVRVAILNGTATPGLAAKVGDDVRSGGFKLGAVTNSESSFDATVVMYARGHEPEAAAVGRQIGVQDVRLMTPEIQRVAKGAQVAVVVGQDRAPAVTQPPVTPTTTPTAVTP